VQRKFKLDGQGRARREAARRRKSEWEVNLSTRNSGSRHVVWIKICGDIPMSPEVIDVHTLHFKPNFKFSRLNYFVGPPVPVGVCAR